MTPLARQEAEARSTGWGGLSSSDSSLSDSRKRLGRIWGLGGEVGALAQGLGLWGPGWASDHRVLVPEQASSLGGEASWEKSPSEEATA